MFTVIFARPDDWLDGTVAGNDERFRKSYRQATTKLYRPRPTRLCADRAAVKFRNRLVILRGSEMSPFLFPDIVMLELHVKLSLRFLQLPKMFRSRQKS
jgi:hypothetical protein